MRQTGYEATPGTPWLGPSKDTDGDAGLQGLNGSSRTFESDERVAVALMTLSADLLRRRHPAVAAMLQYAIVDIIESEQG